MCLSKSVSRGVDGEEQPELVKRVGEPAWQGNAFSSGLPKKGKRNVTAVGKRCAVMFCVSVVGRDASTRVAR